MSANDNTWPRIAVVGAGAVGSYFGAMLARAGASVTLIGRAAHVQAVTRDGLFLDGLRISERVPMRASTDVGAARDAQIVLVCVKTVDTDSITRELAPVLAPGSIVLSLQNGVDNVPRMREAAGIEAIPAVVYVAVAMAAPGHIRHSGRGDLVIGHLVEARPRHQAPRVATPTASQGHARAPDTNAGAVELASLARIFERATIPCRVAPDIRAELWTKMVLNCAYNAISALGRSQYGRMLASAPTRALMESVIAETVAVARAEGVDLAQEAMTNAAWKLGEAMPAALSSTGQDLARGKPTEIDSLNGYIVRRGTTLGVPTPVNQALHTLVKLLEQGVAAE